jgi:hypothetical protein
MGLSFKEPANTKKILKIIKQLPGLGSFFFVDLGKRGGKRENLKADLNFCLLNLGNVFS